ncbi:hypothetical protein SDC9_48259 [bioreactor metagenome]|uniref:Uncharacterized protein n=1 Tax=bioreactor metagenome TaxID=1076179 RepID=A0A644WI98_9ZZZZ
MLGWDYTVDLSTLSLLYKDYKETDNLEFTADGAGRGGRVQWYFRLMRNNGILMFYSYYTLASEGGNQSPEYSVLLGDTWYGPGSTGSPADLGEQLSSEVMSDWDHSEGMHWVIETWDGVSITAWIDENTGLQTANSLTITKPEYVSWRGIHVGSTREELLAVYLEIDPEYQLQVNGTADSLFYGRPIGGYFIGFILKDDCVTQIDLTFAFD